jgi:6-methylsalicylate decarboxylase
MTTETTTATNGDFTKGNDIDVHAHWFPPRIVEAFDALGSRKAWPPHGDSLADRAEELTYSSFDTQILGLGHNQPSFADSAPALRCAQLCNDLYAEEIAKYDNNFKAFGAVPLPHVAEAVSEARRCLHDLSFAGIGIGTTAGELSLSSEELYPLWEFLNEEHSVVFVHPVGSPDTFTRGMEAYMLGPKFGGPHEAGLAGIHLVVSGVTRRFPDIKWILAPMGGTMLYLWRRFEEISTSLGQMDLLEHDPADALRSLYFDTTLSDDPAVLQFAVDAVGAQQLVLGTDSPRVNPSSWLDAIATGLNLNLVDNELDAVRFGNARELGL